MAYDAGEAFLQIVPSFRGVVASIEAEAKKWGATAGKAFSTSFNDTVRRDTERAPLGPSDQETTRRGQQSGGKFAEGFKARVTAALKSLPDVTIGAATNEAEQKLRDLHAELSALSNQRIGVDIDEAEALAKLDRLKVELERLATESPSPSVRMDTAAAAAELAKLRADIDRTAATTPDVTVKANTGDADAKLTATRALADDVDGKSPDIDVSVITGPALAGIGAIGAALAGLAAGAVITPVIGGLASMLGPLTAAVGGVGGLGASAIPGLSAVKDAFTAQTAAEKDASTSADASAKAQVSTANQIKAAELSLADTQRRVANDRITSTEAVTTARQGLARAEQQAAQQIDQAEQQVQSAEMALAGAQRASLAAQKALTDAREAGTRSLQDQAFAAKDAGLQVQADQLAVQAAQENLNRVNGNAKSTDLQRQEAALALTQAQQQLAEQQVTAKRATEDNNKAQKAGVDGSPQVVAANTAITAAQKQQVAAAKALTDARANQAKVQQSTNENVANAEKTLADARRAQTQREAQDASDLTRAQMAVTTAQAASATAADSHTTATRNLAFAMAALTPQELALLDATDRFKTSFIGWAQALEPQVLPLFTNGLGILSGLLPKLNPLITATAGALGGIETSLSNAVSGPGFSKFVGTLTGLVGPTLTGIAKVAGGLGTAFTNVVTAFAPLSTVVIGGLGDLADKLATASSSPTLKVFADTLVAIGPSLVSTFGDIGGLAGKLLGAFAPLSGPVLSVVDTLARSLGSLVDGLSGPVADMFLGLAPVLNQLITTLLPPLTEFFASIAGQVPELALAFADIVVALLPLLPIIAQILTAAIPLLDFLAPLAPYIVAAAVGFQLFSAALPILELLLSPVGLITAAIIAMAAGIILAYNHSQTFHDFINDNVLPVLKALWSYLQTVVYPILKRIADDALAGLNAGLAVVKKALSDHHDELVHLGNAYKDYAKFIIENVLPLLGPILKAAFTGLGLVIGGAITIIAGLVTAFDGVVSAATTVASSVATAFGAVKTSVSAMWTDIKTVFIEGVNYVTQNILNPLIDILDKVLGPFGVDIKHVAKIDMPATGESNVGKPHQGPGGRAVATGGVLPGYTPGRDVHRFVSATAGTLDLSGGEGILRPELVQALGGAPVIDALNAPYNGGVRGGGRSFLGGGVLGALGAITDKIRAGAAGVAIRGLNVAEAPIRALLDLLPDGFAHMLGSGALAKLNSAVDGFIRGTARKASEAVGGVVPTGIHLALINQALGLAGVPVTAGNEAAVDMIVQHESGWNPNAINLTDSNAQAGHPSQGLMQTIPTTFAAYALPGLGGITDPLANLVAGIRYAISTYGSLGNVPGVRGVNSGSNYVGYDNGGFLPPGVTTVFNGTGSPEPVFTSSQFAMLAAGKANVNRSAAPAEFRGELYLDSGEFLGVVRGQVDDSMHDVATMAGRL